MKAIKQQLLRYLVEHTLESIRIVRENLDAIHKAKMEETKSSAGDKYETGRAMMQIEEEQNQKQLAKAQATKDFLSKIETDKSQQKIVLGSLIKTNRGVYFASIGLGKVILEGNTFFCISLDSPIGLHLKNKAVGDTIRFNGNTITIEEIY